MATNRGSNVDNVIEDAERIEEVSARARLAGYGLAAPLLKMREAQMRREVDRVADKKGQDHPDVAARAAAHERFVAKQALFDEELSRARIDFPRVGAEDGAGIWGRVADNGQPVADVTVILQTDGHRVGFDCTDANGGFGMSAPADNDLILSVRSSAGAELYRDMSAMTLSAGQLRFREIDLSLGGSMPCPEPDDGTGEDGTFPMVNLVGQSESAAVSIIQSASLSVGDRTYEVVEEGVGLVLSQEPAAQTPVQSGDVVFLVIGRTDTVDVPNLLGLPEEAADEVLTAADLKLGDMSTTPVSGEQVGLIVDQSPEAGTALPPGSAVAIVVGREDLVEVPDLTGRNEGDAGEILAEVGLILGQVSQIPGPAADAGLVLDQTPDAGATVARNSTVMIMVGRVEGIVTPELLGCKQEEAESILEEVGLSVGNVTTAPSTDSVGLVVDQEPSAGTELPVGGKVSIQVGARFSILTDNYTPLIEVAEKILRGKGVGIGEKEGFLLAKLRNTGVTIVDDLREFVTLTPHEIRDRLEFRNLTITRKVISSLKAALKDADG